MSNRKLGRGEIFLATAAMWFKERQLSGLVALEFLQTLCAAKFAFTGLHEGELSLRHTRLGSTTSSPERVQSADFMQMDLPSDAFSLDDANNFTKCSLQGENPLGGPRKLPAGL